MKAAPVTPGRQQRTKNVTSFAGRRGVFRAALAVAPECAATFGLLILIWLGSWWSLQDQYSSAIAGADRDTANLARAFEENTRRIVAGADQVLLALRSAYARDPANFDLDRWVKRENAPDWLTAQIAIIDRTGMSIASTASSKRVSIADREHFTVQRDSAADDLFISKPVIGRSSKRWTVQLTRKIKTDDGAFDGIVVLSVDCYQLSGLYESLNLEQGYMALFGTDGIVRARGPVVDGAIGATIAAAGLPSDLLTSAHATLHTHSDHGGAIVSYRRLSTYPLGVAVAFAKKPVLAGYRRLRLGLLWSGGTATIAILALGGFWIRQRKRSIASQEALALTLESMNQGLVMVDASRRVRVVNGRALQLLGLPATLLGALRSSRARTSAASERELLTCLHRKLTPASSIEAAYEEPILECSSAIIEGGGAVHVITDVTARQRANERIHQLALHDTLTGLGNRTFFNEHLEAVLQQSKVSGERFSVFSLELNDFRRVIDMLGKELGDQLITLVSQRLGAALDPADLLTRGAGGEFAILAKNVQDALSSQKLTEALTNAFEQRYIVAGQQVSLGVSIGIASFPEHGATRAELVRNADLALSAALADKSTSAKLFDVAMADRVEDRVRLEEDLRAAIDADELFLEYQPQFRTSSLEVVGFEALVRWKHPVKGRIRPDIFIPIAEETGMIIELGRKILDLACATARKWPDHVRIGVNLSPVQFRDPDLLATVADALAKAHLPASRLELEVTEGVLIADEKQALDTLAQLRALGVGLALDDFGTGYASLSYLRKFPFERIKLDQSFVQAQVLDERSRQILQSVLGLARRLGLGVIAEGVETRTQLALLRQQGCDDIQGFLVGKPMPDTDTVQMISPAHSPKPTPAPTPALTRRPAPNAAPQTREWNGASATVRS